ncbi:hypothetical protein HS088_TW01G00996 [Tripterygium wilfordii]|uniref:Uncharacterized protein n=1 Tax=Tripterygium wilfordii TaxID=458696 RepID=A0A7J7E3A0_TRIWF|nr:hypothetical protein HS088_TW01G00996 [Tripterygium wilfordii]
MQAPFLSLSICIHFILQSLKALFIASEFRAPQAMSYQWIQKLLLSVLGKLSNLLIQEYISFLGIDDELQKIEATLRRTADFTTNVVFKEDLQNALYDLEDVIDDDLVSQSAVDVNELRHKLKSIDHIISGRCGLHFKSGSWSSSFGLYNLNIGDTVVSPVMCKFSALATQHKLRPPARTLVRRLRDEFQGLHDYLTHIESKELTESGMAWMEEVCDVSRSAEDAIRLFEYKNEQRQQHSIQLESLKKVALDFLKLNPEGKFVKKVDAILAKVQDISKRRYGAVDWPSPQWHMFGDSSAPSCIAEQLDITSFDDDMNAIIASLLKDNPHCLSISIVGMAGIGKTSLAKMIYDNHAIRSHFPYHAWVAVSSYSSWDGTKQVMQQVTGLQDSDVEWKENEELDDYLCRMRHVLSDYLVDKKYLLIFDGLDTEELWDALGSTFSGTSNGTRIVFTTRWKEAIPQVSNENFTYSLHLRSDDETWALFTHSLKANIPKDLLKLMRSKILRTCGGLPRVIVKLGETLSQKDATVEEWTKVLEQFNEDREPWSAALDEINKKMPLYLRRCLFYFGLFPKGFEIPVRRLIALWVAEGLGKKDNPDELPEKVSESCLEELVNQNMVQVTKRKLNGKTQTCRLPNAFQEHWLSKAKEANFLQGHSCETRIRRVADHLQSKDSIFDHIHGNDRPSSSSSSSLYSSYRDVISLLSFDTREGSKPGEEIGDFLDVCISQKCFQDLRVLDLEHVFQPKLSKAIAELARLRYLGLRWTSLKKLPSFISKLLNLQTLDLKRTSIDTLPSSIWMMQQLRHLYLDDRNSCRFVPRPRNSSMTDLQTLWGLFVDEESPVVDGLDTLIKLRKLGLICRMMSFQEEAMLSQLEAVGNWVQKLGHLECLRLKSYDRLNQPWELPLKSLSGHSSLTSIYLVGKLKNKSILSQLPQSLIEITLSASALAEDPMQILNQLPKLRFLRLLSKSYAGNTMLCSPGGFPELRVLHLWGLESLQAWTVEEEAMPLLKHLEIKACQNLRMLPNGVQQITTLRIFKLSKMPREFTDRIKDDQHPEHHKIAHVSYVSMD